MAIERFVWTDHALQRLEERGLTRFEVIEAVYDHPHGGDETIARIVSVWQLAEESG